MQNGGGGKANAIGFASITRPANESKWALWKLPFQCWIALLLNNSF